MCLMHDRGDSLGNPQTQLLHVAWTHALLYDMDPGASLQSDTQHMTHRLN